MGLPILELSFVLGFEGDISHPAITMKDTIFYGTFVLEILARYHRILNLVASEQARHSRTISFGESALPMHVVIFKLATVFYKLRMVFPYVDSLLLFLPSKNYPS